SLDRLAQAEVDPSSSAHFIAERARELSLEAQLVEAVGTGAFPRLACARYPLPRGNLAEACESTARTWIADKSEKSRTEQSHFLSDDRSERNSLWSVMSKRIGQLRLPVRLRIDSNLMSVAACGTESVTIRGGTWLTAMAARRIAEHEIVGHLLPRQNACRRTDILHCGCASATDDEEGRALLIEERQGLMDASRRIELATRHLACLFLRRGATFIDSVRCLVDWGAPLEIALRSAVRASRGGGMGREIVYLPAMQRLAPAFASNPSLESCFEMGRASLEYALARQAQHRAA
ncbi:MAG TPA: tyrosine/phenylalanine carboxypeptidase domain-containing protein, partial [Polyangiaceae bacterium]